MRCRRRYALGASLLILASVAASAAGARAVHDLGAVPGAIRQQEGKQSFAREIEGRSDPSPLGAALPAGLQRETVIRLIAPGADPARITLVGAKRWSHPAQTYVAIVCAAHDKADIPRPGAMPACDNSPDVFLGLLRIPAGGGPARLVARTPKGFVLNSEWSPPQNAPILLPSVAPVDEDLWPHGRSDATVAGFDLAPYRIAPGVFAFGLRSDQNEGYAGGYATFETLSLFAARGATLWRVLAQPVYALSMTAGDWHRDGTRDHEIREARLVLSILPSMTAGHYDLRVKELGRRGTAVLHWNAARSDYWVPAP